MLSMRIAIDARLYGPARNKGLGRYVEQLVKNLEVIDKENEYLIFLRKTPSSDRAGPSSDKAVSLSDEAGNWDEYQPENPRFKRVLADYKWYSLAEQLMMPIKIWKAKVDLVHFPHFNVPLFCLKKFVVTIHDLIMYKFPNERVTTRNKLLYKIKYWLHKIVVRQAVRRAEKVIVSSEWTRKDLLKEFGINPQKVVVIYLGYETGGVNTVNKVNTVVNKVNRDNIFKKFGIVAPYLLYVGNAYPHKNLERLIKAYKLVKERGKQDLQLVLVGKKDYFYKQLIKKARAQRINEVIFTDYVLDDELVALYQNARAYVFPSLYEGFGLPGLEAMACGLPVVSSKTSCLPEIYGKAALYFDPKDTGDMYKKIVQLFKDENLRKDLRNRGFEQIKKYSWRKCAKETSGIYTQAG